MTSPTFSKTHLTYDEQIDLLQSRGLLFSDRKYAKVKLEHISYYRFSAYYLPFQKEKDVFVKDSKFEDVLDLYYFDKELRKIIFNAIETVEINVRANVVYNFSKETDTFGYMEKSCLNIDDDAFVSLINGIQRETSRSKELFVKHFKNKYKSDVLPIWMMVEIISFGTLSRFFSALRPEQETLTKKVNIPPAVFKNWLHMINHIRNICAHHSRLWNKKFVIKAKLPRKIKEFNSIQNDKVFVVILILSYFFKGMKTSEGFVGKIDTLIKDNPNINIENMGFPDNWKERLI